MILIFRKLRNMFIEFERNLHQLSFFSLSFCILPKKSFLLSYNMARKLDCHGGKVLRATLQIASVVLKLAFLLPLLHAL